MELTIGEQAWHVFQALFASGFVFAVINHFLIVSVSVWKQILK